MIEHKSGKQNIGVDALSRVSCFPLSMFNCDLLTTFREELKDDPQYNTILTNCDNDISLHPFRTQDGLLFKNDHLVIPSHSPLTLQLVKEFHNFHWGTCWVLFLRNIKRLTSNFPAS